MDERSVTHATFVIERPYDASPARVFAAFADPVVKRRWFVEGEGWKVDEFEVDFRVGGYERSRFRYKEGPVIRNDTVYQDIVPDRRVIIAYSMTIGDTRISASLATVEFKLEGSGTRLVYTEQGAFLDGADKPADREAGCRMLLEALDAELKRVPASA
ncbi:SRPBCC family protein [Rhodospirillaceae bacterium SYSU D60014]|uniref:SRPBCC family protein n=1 Tax=Virgifigura deserti TaxID=2268457 RepID=UPI000E66604E